MARSLDMALGRLAVVLILAYQRHLSPLKGFRCAHRAKHGGESCSEFARQIFARHGALAGLRGLRARFRECSEASRALRAEQQSQRVGREHLDESGEGKASRGREPGECSPGAIGLDMACEAGECCCCGG